MYTLAQKNKIIKLFKKGESISSIHLHSNISKSTLYRWNEQFKISKEKSKKVNKLISQGELQEAEELAEEILALDSKNLHARSQLISIYKQQGKTDEVERLVKEILALDPNDLRARSELINIYKQQGKIEEVERLAKEILELDPNNLPAKKQLIAIHNQQRMEYKTKKEQIPEVNFAEQIQSFRKQIHDGTITADNLPQYEEKLLTLPTAYQKVLLAEAYTKFNIPKKAIQLLKEARKS